MNSPNPFSEIPVPKTDGSFDAGVQGSSTLPETDVTPSMIDDKLAPRAETTIGGLSIDSFNEIAVALAQRLEAVSNEGNAVIQTVLWNSWNEGSGYGEEPEESRTVSYDEIAKLGKGWKLHLNFDAENIQTVSTVRTFLKVLKDHDAITTFKIGEGGGKEYDAPGKEATVYVGHRDKASMVAQAIEESLASILIDPEGDTITDDIEFMPHVMGRFEVGGLDPEFHQYGAKGHPLPRTAIRDLIFSSELKSDLTARQKFISEQTAIADTVLRDRYGVFYTGNQVTS
ncbi:MAG: hypothetical protein QG628_103 [Patescibacteria group bacterium]|nr:hypothetical protein [Patescibacteria group bacterium]